MRRLIRVARTAIGRWSDDKAPKMAAALAFYSSFALAPLLFIAIAIAGLVFSQDAARLQVVGQIQELIGENSARAVDDILQKVNTPKTGALASLLGLAALLFGASGVFAELQDSLNVVWRVKKKPGRGLLGTAKDRFLSFSMVLGLGFLLLISLVVSAGLAALSELIGGADAGVLLKALSFVFGFAVVTAIFSLMFRFLPDARTRWTEALVGGAVTAFLFTLGKFAIGLYLGRGTVATTYGAAGAFLLVLLWVYYSSQILLLGAEVTKAYADLRGHAPAPDPDAVRADAAARPRKLRRSSAGGGEIVIQLGDPRRSRRR
jgi:membrane protein